MEKNPGVKNFGNEREGRFREILSCPPKMHVAPQMLAQIPRLASPLLQKRTCETYSMYRIDNDHVCSVEHRLSRIS